MTKWKPDRLKGEARAGVMRQYTRGMLTVREAACIIGVKWQTVHRSAPRSFDWREARLEYVHRVTRRYQPIPLAPLSDEVLPY